MSHEYSHTGRTRTQPMPPGKHDGRQLNDGRLCFYESFVGLDRLVRVSPISRSDTSWVLLRSAV